MTKKVAVIFCLLVLCCVLADSRWHDLRNLRKYRTSMEPSMPRILDDSVSRHRRHRPLESMPNDESMEDKEEINTAKSLTRMEFDGDPDYLEQDELIRVPRRRLVQHQTKKSHHRRHHVRHHKKATLVDLDDAMLSLEYDDGVDLSRDKRHQRRKNWTEEDWQAFENSRRPELYDHDIHVFELEVREAQNSSLCNYTVIPIPDPGGRVPRVLEHIKCNYVGNRCRERGSYCCVQTYRNVEVTYPGNKNDTIKLYSGCVCALQIYGTLKPYNPKLPLDY